MTLPNFNTEQFFEYINKSGAKKIADYPEDYVVVYKHKENIVPIQIRQTYFPTYVAKICEQLNVKCPRDFKIVDDQIKEMKRRAAKRQAEMNGEKDSVEEKDKKSQ